MRTWKFPRESREMVGPLEVDDNKVDIPSFDVCLLQAGRRPAETDWKLVDQHEGRGHIWVGPGATWSLTPGRWFIWVRYDNGIEAPVEDQVGIIQIE